MKNKRQISSICIGVCILFVGISLVALKAGKPGEEGVNFENQPTAPEKEGAYYELLEKYLARMIKRTCKVSNCEVVINHLEGEIVGVGIEVAVSEESTGNDTLKTDISGCVSKALDVTGERIEISVQ